MQFNFNKAALHIVGWDKIIAPLVAFFLTVRKVKEEGIKNGCPDLSLPILFLAGLPGTGKSAAATELSEYFGWVSALIDVSTVDDVSEIFGIPNIHALKEEGRVEFIRGPIARAQIPVFDELPNAANHVLRQLRGALRGNYMSHGQPVQLDFISLIATGNTDADLKGKGHAQPLDLANAKRVMMTVRVPSLQSMERAAQRAMFRWHVDPKLRHDECARFAEKLAVAAAGAYAQYDTVNSSVVSEQITEYGLTVLASLKADKAFDLEGREAQLYQVALTAGVALSRADPVTYPLPDVVWDVTKALFSYVELMGVDKPDFSKLEAAHKVGMEHFAAAGAATAIFAAQTVAEKVGLVLQHRDELGLVTKLQVVKEVSEGDDLALKLAVIEALGMDACAAEPAELKALVERSLPVPEDREIEIAITDLSAIACLAEMTTAEQLVYKSNMDETAMDRLLSQVKVYLASWTIS